MLTGGLARDGESVFAGAKSPGARRSSPPQDACAPTAGRVAPATLSRRRIADPACRSSVASVPSTHPAGRDSADFSVRRQARVEPSHDDGSHLPPPGGHGAHRGNLRQLRHGIQAAGTRADTARARDPRDPSAARPSPRSARARAAPRDSFSCVYGAPLAIDRQLTSSPRAGPLRVRVQAPELRGRDQVHQGIHRAVQRGASNAAAPPSGGRGQPSPRDRTHQGFGRSFHRPPVCLFCCRFFVFFRERRARRSRDASAPLRRAPFVFLSRRERRRLTRFVHHVRASYYIRTRRRDARRCPSSSRRPLWRL